MVPQTVMSREDALKRSPWPGPRPFDTEGENRLYGRDREVREVRQRLAQHRVILFHAHSGVGKSSLLRAGLHPALKRNGQIVLLCEWGDLAEGDGKDPGAEFFAGALSSGLRKRRILLDLCERYQRDREHRTFVEDALDALEAPEFRSPVLVFDQVEEVMRRDRPLANAFFAEVSEVAYNYPRLAQIISFRSEYKAYETLDRSLISSKIATEYELKPLSEDEVVEAICLPARDWSEKTGIPLAVEEAAARMIVGWWTDARELQTGVGNLAWRQDLPEYERAQLAKDIKELGESEVGLLHVQAVLDALFQRWVAMDPELPPVIDTPFVETFRDVLVPEELIAGRTSARVMVESLRQYIRRTFERASAAELPGVPEGITALVRSLVQPTAATMAPMLSSSGFKTAREAGELGAESVTKLLNPLPVDEKWVGETVKALARTLTENRATEPRDLAAVGIGELLPEDAPEDVEDAAVRDIHSLHGQPSDVDVPNVAGPARALGMTQEQVVAAGALAAALAIAAMANEQVLRKSPTSRQAIYELVHDGFGPALRSWALDVLDRPWRRIESPVTVLGEDIVWSVEEAEGDDSGTQRKIDGSEIKDVRWVGCWIGTPRHEPRLRMHKLKFTGAELRGTVIEHAHLKGVEFVDCLLNGILFRNCVMEDVLFAWTDKNTPNELRNCDMLTFRQILTRPDEAADAAVSSRGPAVGPRFENITIRNVSVHDAEGVWKATRAHLEQVSLDADKETKGTARFEVTSSSLRQWRFGHNWSGTLWLNRSDIDFSVVYGIRTRIERSSADDQTRVGQNNAFNAVNNVVLDGRNVDVLTDHRDGHGDDPPR